MIANSSRPRFLLATLNRLLGDGLSYAYPTVALVTLVEVIARYIFRQPTSWSVEISIALAALHYVLSGPQVTADRSHIAIDLLLARLRPAFRRNLDGFHQFVGALVFGALSLWAIRQAASSIELGERTGSTVNLPIPIVLKTAVAAALVLMAAQAFVNALVTLTSRDEP